MSFQIIASRAALCLFSGSAAIAPEIPAICFLFWLILTDLNFFSGLLAEFHHYKKLFWTSQCAFFCVIRFGQASFSTDAGASTSLPIKMYYIALVTQPFFLLLLFSRLALPFQHIPLLPSSHKTISEQHVILFRSTGSCTAECHAK